MKTATQKAGDGHGTNHEQAKTSQSRKEDQHHGARHRRKLRTLRGETLGTPMNKPCCEVARRASQDAVERRS